MTEDDLGRNGADIVTVIANRIRSDYADVASIDVKSGSGYPTDVIVSPRVSGAARLSVIGLGADLILTIAGEGYRRWELPNSPAGRLKLDRLIADAIEGRMSIRRGLVPGWRRCPPYR